MKARSVLVPPKLHLRPLVLLVLPLLFLIAACGSDDPTATPTAAPLPTATPPPAEEVPDEMSGFEAEWEELVAAAQEEGRLGIAAGGQPSRTYRPLLDRFQDKFDISVEMSTGGATDTVNRVLAERDADTYTVDVALISVRIMNTRFIPAGALVPVDPWLIHPDILDTSMWQGGRHWYGDEEQQRSFIYSVSIAEEHEFWYNTDEYTAEEIAEIQDPWDFFDEKYRGKIAGQGLGDPSGIRGVVNAYWEPTMGPEWVRTYLTDAEVTFVDDRRVLETWLTQGRYPLQAIGGGGADLRDLKESGLPIDFATLPLELPGLRAGGSGCCLAIFDRAPNPNAAKLFVNWFLSAEGQTALHETIEQSQSSSLLNGIPLGLVLPEGRRDLNKTYDFPDADPGFAARLEEGQAYAFEVWETR